MFVVTGGGSGIGRSMAQALATRGHAVLVVGRRLDALKETAQHHQQITCFAADVACSDDRGRLTEYLTAYDSIQGLIHNAGIIEPIVPLQSITAASWQHLLETNLNAPLFITQALKEKLGQGRILHIGSGAAYFPIQGWAAYCVSKAALAMLTRCWQLECPEMACASVMPGIIDTAMQEKIRHADAMAPDKQLFFRQLKQHQQLLTSDTVAAFLCWLMLDIPVDRYVSQEWDIYNTEHHAEWLVPPYQVPTWE